MYQHTQIGWIIFGFTVPAVIFLAIWSLAVQPIFVMIFTAAALALMLVLFGSLTVKADGEGIGFHFGPGILKRRFPYKDIASVKKVRNRWYFGWGVRWFGRGWLYNVSGLDAIEVALQNGKCIRIGTDQPDELLRFVSPRLKTN